MTEEIRLILEALSVSLMYPGERLPAEPPWKDLPPSRYKQRLTVFWKTREETPLLQLQEEYTNTFDLNALTCLNASFHLDVGGRRGNLLISLQRIYEDAGFENVSTELPDYLPLILEFLTLCPEETRRRICREYREAIDLLARRLENAKSSYAPLLEATAELFSFLEKKEEAAHGSF